MSVNYDRVCRLCLSSRGELLPIFPTTSPDESEPPILASKIKDCVSVQINENDELPGNVCRKCMDNVNNWHIFKSVCERTQNKLQSLLNKDGSQLEEVHVKSEPFPDEAYDEGVVIDGSYPDEENVADKIQPEGPPILASLGLTPRSDKKYVDPRMDWHRVHAILDMVQDDEMIDSLQSTEESDVLHCSEHDSDSEADLESNAEDDFPYSKNEYVSKNKKKISTKPKIVPVLTLTKFKEAMKNKKPLQSISAWQRLFTDDLLNMIVNSTNDNISQNENAPSTTTTEIKQLIGILYLHGVMRPTHPKSIDLWHDEYGMVCVKNAMEYERFQFLLQNLSFYDKTDEESILQFDTMKRIRKFFEMFTINCRQEFEIGNIAVVDEIVLPIHGPCPFRFDIKKKTIQSGIKIALLVDPSNIYVSNINVITDPYLGPDDVVKKLVKHLSGSRKTIIMDSWYTSIPFIVKLKNEDQLFSIAALKPTDQIIPQQFLSKSRKAKSLVTGFMENEITITSFVNDESKAVNVLTNDPRYYRKTSTYNASAVAVYAKNHTIVEVTDILMHYYTTMQNTNDWTLSLFFTLLNIASINAQVIWLSQSTNRVVHRRFFIKNLATSLLSHERKRGPLMEFATRPLKMQRVTDTQIEIATPTYRKKCTLCWQNGVDRRTKQICQNCGVVTCKEHTRLICLSCN